MVCSRWRMSETYINSATRNVTMFANCERLLPLFRFLTSILELFILANMSGCEQKATVKFLSQKYEAKYLFSSTAESK